MKQEVDVLRAHPANLQAKFPHIATDLSETFFLFFPEMLLTKDSQLTNHANTRNP